MDSSITANNTYARARRRKRHQAGIHARLQPFGNQLIPPFRHPQGFLHTKNPP